MEKNSTEFMQQVYDLATGAYNPGSSIVAENAFVENVFSEGSVCAEAYREVYAAGERLCRRSGRAVRRRCGRGGHCGQHDGDPEGRIGLKMYEYGWYFAKGGDGIHKV